MTYALLSLFAFLGLANALFLNWQYRRYLNFGKPMYCLMKEDCAAIIGSKYGTTMGLKNERFGIAYYLVIILYSHYLIGSGYSSHSVEIFIEIITFLATLFSLYLLVIQAFVLKKFCSWCLIAIALNFLIFWGVWTLLV